MFAAKILSQANFNALIKKENSRDVAIAISLIDSTGFLTQDKFNTIISGEYKNIWDLMPYDELTAEEAKEVKDILDNKDPMERKILLIEHYERVKNMKSKKSVELVEIDPHKEEENRSSPGRK